MKIFIGGKIHEGYFRKGLVEGDLQYQYKDGDKTLYDYDAIIKLLKLEQSIVLKNSIFGKYDYIGAYFIGSDKFNNSENVKKKFKKDNLGKLSTKKLVADIALQNIRQCDLFFAWLDTEDAFGTIVEIGYAKALNKPIYLAGYEKYREMWFAYKMAKMFIYEDDSKAALKYAIDDYEKSVRPKST